MKLDEVIALLDVAVSPSICMILNARKTSIERMIFDDGNVATITAERCDPETWNRIRQHVLQRDSYTCQGCAAACTVLNVHHIVPLSRGGSDDPSNLHTLCNDCHAKIHPWLGGLEGESRHTAAGICTVQQAS